MGATLLWWHYDEWFEEGKNIKYKDLLMEELEALARLRGMRTLPTKNELVA